MKTTMMAGVCLLALVLTFTIAECGPTQEKRQASCDEIQQDCLRACDLAGGGYVAQCRDSCTCEDSGATAIAGATIFPTISALLVAVASAMN